ncbi:hypothetical protein [Nocardioides jishulii]|uniref:Uncharacterized protein n=1 Tax=Nocardioides jishulii TaxID=2575440 RepID=A0A4U2YV36_9ACTN|nr:hypothetical protein [Nocardioides jishulii]QCX26225.1 hypothetical protein FCL41_00730 [Nocardioides jishulii]TKI63971.1 hypothetical protein FC770_01975 [Nocardioides jishulii]
MLRPFRTATFRTGALAAGLLLTATLTACGEVEIGDARTSGASPAETTASATPTLTERLNPEASTVGDVTLHLPLGWVAVAGQPFAAAGTDAPIGGATMLTTALSEGKTASQWAEAIVAGESDLVDASTGLTIKGTVEATGGRELVHVSHDYADGRANFFVTVEGDTLYLVRFGGDGSTEAQTVAVESAATLTIGVAVADEATPGSSSTTTDAPATTPLPLATPTP